jgi:hypothetical protein
VGTVPASLSLARRPDPWDDSVVPDLERHGRAGRGEEAVLRFAHVAAALAAASVAVLAGSCAGSPGAKRAQVLPFVEDDYGRALQEARARKLPIFADAWAPW